MDKHNRDLLIRALKGTLDTASRREFDLWVSNADNLRIYENALRIWVKFLFAKEKMRVRFPLSAHGGVM